MKLARRLRASAGRENRPRGPAWCFPLLFAALTGRSGRGLARRLANSWHRCGLPARPLGAAAGASEAGRADPPARRFEIEVNGRLLAGDQPPDGTLLAFLRDHGLTGAKEACGRGECGACTVLIEGDLRLACVTLSATVTGPVTTVEGPDGTVDVVREAFADHAAFQCGYCTPGHVVTASALLAGGRVPDREQLRHRISGNICRCTGYSQILDAIGDAAERLG